MQRLWARCTLQTQITSDNCHSLALHTAKASRQLQTQISPGKSSMHGQFYREGMRALTNLLFKWKGVKSLLGAAFWEKKNYFINQLPPETIVLLSPQTVITFCSSETLFLVCFCSWRGQDLAPNKKDLKHPLKSCSVTTEFRRKQRGLQKKHFDSF